MISYKVFINLLLLSFCTTAFPNNAKIFLGNCNKETSACKLYATLTNGKTIIIDNDYSIMQQNKGWIKKISPDLWEVGFSCGNPCNETYFIDINTGKKSKSFFLVKKVDSTHKLVTYSDITHEKTSSIFMPIKK